MRQYKSKLLSEKGEEMKFAVEKLITMQKIQTEWYYNIIL